jgi:hypothetical protein
MGSGCVCLNVCWNRYISLSDNDRQSLPVGLLSYKTSTFSQYSICQMKVCEQEKIFLEPSYILQVRNKHDLQYIELRPLDPDSEEIWTAAMATLPAVMETFWLKSDVICQIKQWPSTTHSLIRDKLLRGPQNKDILTQWFQVLSRQASYV